MLIEKVNCTVTGICKMNNTKNRRYLLGPFTIIVLLVLVGGIVILNGLNNPDFVPNLVDKTINIGAVLPLSGAAAYSGEQVRDGMLLAIEEFNSKGSIHQQDIDLIIEDSKGDPKEGVNAFNYLVNIKTQDVIISGLSSVSTALVPLAKEKEIPLLATTATTPNITKNEFSFRYYTTAQQELEPIIKIANELQTEKIAILYLNDEFGVSMFKTLDETYRGLIIAEAFPISTTDFKTQLLKIEESNPDALLIVGFSNHIINVIKQMNELNLKLNIFTPSTASFTDVRKALNEMNVSVYAGVPKIYGEGTSQQTKSFKATFKQKYDKEADQYAAAGYDLINIISQATQNQASSREGIKIGLSEMKHFEGVLGPIKVQGREFNFLLYPAKIEKGEVEYLIYN